MSLNFQESVAGFSLRLLASPVPEHRLGRRAEKEVNPPRLGEGGPDRCSVGRGWASIGASNIPVPPSGWGSPPPLPNLNLIVLPPPPRGRSSQP